MQKAVSPDSIAQLKRDKRVLTMSQADRGFEEPAPETPAVDEHTQAAPAPEDDASLARQARQNPEAFGRLYERYVGAIYRYVYYRVGNSEDAEDLTARVFMRALKHVHNYRDRGVPFSAWLYRIAHNVVANFHRDNSRHPSVPLDDAQMELHGAHHDDADLKIDVDRQRDRLIRAIRLLPEDRQQLVVLKFVEQMQNAEIGQIMNRSEGAVKSLYHRTLAQLREVLDGIT